MSYSWAWMKPLTPYYNHGLDIPFNPHACSRNKMYSFTPLSSQQYYSDIAKVCNMLGFGKQYILEE